MGKKLLSIMLALVMALGMAVCGGAEGERTEGVQEELYTLWDIPFGCTPDEAIELAEKNAGVLLYKEYGSSGQCINLVQGQQKIKVLGWEVDKVSLWLTNGKYDHGIITYSLPIAKDYKMLAWIAGIHIQDMYNKLTKLYGRYTDARAFNSDVNANDISITYYVFPEMGGKLDERLVMQMLEESLNMYYKIVWNNVEWEIDMYTDDKGNKGIRWLLHFYYESHKVKQVDADEIKCYPKKEGYLTYEEEILLEEEKANRTGPEVHVGL